MQVSLRRSVLVGKLLIHIAMLYLYGLLCQVCHALLLFRFLNFPLSHYLLFVHDPKEGIAICHDSN